jgi:hypothetical protein
MKSARIFIAIPTVCKVTVILNDFVANVAMFIHII